METKSIGDNGPSSEEIAIIEKATGGKIGTHEWWVIKGVDGDINPTVKQKPSNEADIIFHGVLENSFMSQDGEYIGDFSRAEWYYKHKLKVYEPYPHGVAESYNEAGELEGYCGYTHRGANIYRLGDRLFDEAYEPVPEDYTPEQWAKWQQEYEDSLAEARAEGSQWWIDDITNDGICACVPFKMRGSKIIETFEEAAQAAINLSNHLS